MKRTRILIMGAAGRDFHNFNVFFRNDDRYEVMAFTATQIPDIEDRSYPPSLSGALYPEGIPIFPESSLQELIRKMDIDQVIFSYSDISHQDVMHKASTCLAAGADFRLLGPRHTMLKSHKPVISVCAVRTGVGKSQTTRKVCLVLKELSQKVVAVRHPMPYGDLSRQVCQRFETFEDLKKHNCTIEENEEYAPHIERGIVVYAGVDYEQILREAEKESDVIVWDGGNNDLPFFKPDLHIVLVDPLRPGHEESYHPGEANLKMADIVIINKVDSAKPEDVRKVWANITRLNPGAHVMEAASPITLDNPEMVKGKRVLVIEDGPTLTHGGMTLGAGFIAAKKHGASEIVNPVAHAVGSIKEVYEKFPHLKHILPAMGYSEKQVDELKETIESTPCDLVVFGTPVDLRKVMRISKPAVRVTYELAEIGKPDLKDYIVEFLEKIKANRKE